MYDTCLSEAMERQSLDHVRLPPTPPMRLCLLNPSSSAVIFSQIAQALIIGSVFYGTPLSTGSFFAKGSVLFFAVLLSALQSIVEINTLYAQRSVPALSP